MAVDVLLVVADDALRTVLEIALTADGCTVRTAATEDDVAHALSGEPARTILLDLTAPFSGRVLTWAERYAPHIPMLLLVTAWEEAPAIAHRKVATLTMPFGRQELRDALATVYGAHEPR
jgi:DNA-binding NtrC family response regulator